MTVTEVTPVRVTVTVVEPEHAEQLPALAVTVAEPARFPAVTSPEVCPTDRAPEGLATADQVTPEFSVFCVPSL